MYLYHHMEYSHLLNYFSVHGLWWRHCTCLWSKVCGPETNLHRAWGSRQLPHDCARQNIHRVIRLHYESLGRLGYKVIFEMICPMVHNLFPWSSVRDFEFLISEFPYLAVVCILLLPLDLEGLLFLGNNLYHKHYRVTGSLKWEILERWPNM